MEAKCNLYDAKRALSAVTRFVYFPAPLDLCFAYNVFTALKWNKVPRRESSADHQLTGQWDFIMAHKNENSPPDDSFR